MEEPRTLHEPMSHGDLLLPLMVHEFTSDPAAAQRVSAHWHGEYELLRIAEGIGECRINDHRFTVKTGELVFVAPGQLHGLTAEPGTPLAFCAVVFAPAMIESRVNDAIEQQYIRAVETGELVLRDHLRGEAGWEQAVLAAFDDLRNCFAGRPPCFELRLKADLFTIWYQLAGHPLAAGQAARPNEAALRQTKQMLEYLQQHYNARLRLEDLAVVFHLSEGQLCRFFKAQVGMTVVEYLNSYRIAKAAALLRQSGREIGEIAGDTGFDTISYFNRVFQRQMHCTPSAYRRAAQMLPDARPGDTA